MGSPRKIRAPAEPQHGHTRARRLQGRVARSTEWCEFACVPSSASRRAKKCRREPYRTRRCGGSGEGWLGGYGRSGGDDERGNVILRKSWRGCGDVPSSKRTEKLSWSLVFRSGDSFGELRWFRRARVRCASCCLYRGHKGGLRGGRGRRVGAEGLRRNASHPAASRPRWRDRERYGSFSKKRRPARRKEERPNRQVAAIAGRYAPTGPRYTTFCRMTRTHYPRFLRVYPTSNRRASSLQHGIKIMRNSILICGCADEADGLDWARILVLMKVNNEESVSSRGQGSLRQS